MRLVSLIIFVLCLNQPALAEVKWVLQRDYVCKEIDHPLDGQDYVFSKCVVKDFPTLWFIYQDSARAQFGFGTRPNFSSGTGSLKQSAGPIEWGGTYAKGNFVPTVAIARLYFDDYITNTPTPRTTLQIFRLLPDGTSCLVGSAQQNSKARILAARAMKTWKCLGKPEIIDLPK